jgi:TolB-like protein/Flp pilus assembly protein TadD
MSEDSGQDYLCDGITEEIITALSKCPFMFVIARNSSFTYKGKPVKVQQVAEDLGVRYVLEGSVQKSGERLRITVQFIDALKGHHLWSERYDRELRDLFAIEDDITKKIITALQVILTHGEQARIYARGTENLDAYLKFLNARENVFRFNKDANLVARQQAEEAIALDPKYSNAHTLLGKTYIGAIFFGWSPSPKEALGRAFESAKKALALDESNLQAHMVLAFVHLLKKEHDAAVEECERAVSLAPNAADSLYNLGVILRFAGRVREAISMFEKAMRLNPIPPASYLYQLALSYTFVGEFEKAIRLCKEALSKNPDDLVGRVTLIVAYGSLGREEEVRTQVSELLRVDPKFSLEQAARTWPYKKESDREFVLARLRKAGLPDNPPLSLPDKPSIAVLAFNNMTGDPQQEYFSDGMADQLITGLSQTPDIYVSARSSSIAYKGKSMTAQQIADQLKVRYLLEGSVQRDADRVRINVQLIDGRSGNHVWSEYYDRKLEDLFAMQDQITMAVMAAVNVKLTLGTGASLKYSRPSNLKAYEYYLKGLYHQSRRNQQDLITAGQMFEEAINHDPNFAAAYRSLGFVHADEVWFRMTKSPEKSIEQAEQAAKKFITLTPNQPPPYPLLSMISLLKKDLDNAILYGEKAIEFNPNESMCYLSMGLALRMAGRYEEAITNLQTALRLAPLRPLNFVNNLAWSYLGDKQYEKAISLWSETLDRNPDYLFAYMGLTAAYELSGNHEKARWAAENVMRVNPKFSIAIEEKSSTNRDEAYKKRIFDAYRSAGLK